MKLESCYSCGEQSSVEIAQNAKGEARVTVKVYHADPLTAANDAISIYEHTVVKLGRQGLCT